MKLSLLIIGLILYGFGFVEPHVENRIIGKPLVSCLKTGVFLEAEVEKIFEGQIYVRGSRNTQNCWKKYENGESRSRNLQFQIDKSQLTSCGFQFSRIPASSKYLGTGNIIVAFHPDLVTSSDRAFSVNCEFEDENLIENNLETTKLYGELKYVPKISMSIESQQGNRKEFEIGEPLIFKWEFVEKKQGILGLSLERCSAETSDGRGMRILENGCSLDEELISDSMVSPDYTRILANSEAFKFPDETQVFIRCYVKICVKRFNHLSNSISSDLCPVERSCSEKLRNRRELRNSTLIPITANYRIRRSQALKSDGNQQFQICMHENVYFLGISSIFIMYLLTFSTFVFIRKIS
ncbi:unnamed protein product [Caenorhabditis angaria]|uniref:ZP domain-containing protein n=1 Tax=Caenorhabditis angaria TaxID=860376 RepID=A0A9P1N3F4_9PELO|nr:unnamed protein product [Caenorhabditis angaria]